MEVRNLKEIRKVTDDIFMLNNLTSIQALLNAQQILKICLKLYFNLDKWKGWRNFKRCAHAILIYEN